MRHCLPLALAVCGFAVCNGAHADFRADFAVVKGGNGDHALSRIELSGNRMRTDAGNVSMLFDGSGNRMIVLMHDKKKYMDMAKMAETAGAAMARAQAALANLPPEQRAMVEQQMGKHMPGMGGAKVNVSITPTGAHDRVDGYPCEVYTTTIDGRHSSDSCLTPLAAAGISAADAANLRNAFVQLQALTEKMSGGMFKSPLSGMPTDRFPVRIVKFDDGRAGETVELKSLSTSGVPAGDFAIPPGYAEQTMGNMERGR
ncbi:MAG: DUF4412 domain-containing protein [Rudaea sp.]